MQERDTLKIVLSETYLAFAMPGFGWVDSNSECQMMGRNLKKGDAALRGLQRAFIFSILNINFSGGA